MNGRIASWTFAVIGLGASIALGAGIIGAATASEDAKKLSDRSEYTDVGASGAADGVALSVEQILAKVKERGFTEVYEVERERGAYEVKARDAKGALMEIYVDAKTGEILKSEYED